MRRLCLLLLLLAIPLAPLLPAAGQEKSRGRSLEQLAEDAQAAHEQRQFDQAKLLWRELIALLQASPQLDQETRERWASRACFKLACVAALQGDKRQALTWLNRAFESGLRDFQKVEQEVELAALEDDQEAGELLQTWRDVAAWETLRREAVRLYNAREYGRARVVCQQALKHARAKFGEDSVRTIATLDDLSFVLEDMAASLLSLGRDNEARLLFERVLREKSGRLGGQHHDLRFSLEALGLLALRRKDSHQAISYLERCLKIREAMLGQQDEELALRLEQLAGLYEQDPASGAKAVAAYQRAVDIRTQVQGQGHVATVEAVLQLADCLKALGQRARARALYLQAVHASAASERGKPASVKSLRALARFLQNTGEYAEALPHFQSIVAIHEAAPGEDAEDLIQSLRDLGFLHMLSGRYRVALALMERALGLQRERLGKDHLETANLMRDLAVVKEKMGLDDDALRLFRAALRTKEKNLGPEHFSTGATLFDLVGLLDRLGQYGEAKVYGQRALGIFERTLGPEHSAVASALHRLALVLLHLNEIEAARPLLERGLKLSLKTFGPDHTNTGSAYNNLALLHQQAGKHAEARPLFEQALRIQKAALGTEHPKVAVIAHNLAATLCKQGEIDKATELLAEALAVRQRRCGPGHPLTIDTTVELALIAQQRGEQTKSVRMFREAWEARKKSALLCLRSISPKDRLSYLESHAFHLTAYLSLKEESPKRRYSALLFWKGLARRLAVPRSHAIQNKDPEIRELAWELRGLDRQLSELMLAADAPGGAGQASLMERAQTLQQRRRLMEDRLSALDAEHRQRGEGDQTLSRSVDELLACLPPDTALIDFYRFRDRYSAWALLPGSPPREVLIGGPETTAAQIDSAVQSFRHAFITGDPGAAQERGEVLRRWLWMPLQKAFGKARPLQLIVCPDGSLWRLPFALLPVQKDGRLLIDDHLLCVLPSAAALMQPRMPSRAALPGRFLLVGGIDYGAQPDGRGTFRFGPLEGTIAEIRSLDSLLSKAGVPGSTLEGASATEGAFTAVVGSASIVHIASHGFLLEGRNASPWGAVRAPVLTKQASASPSVAARILGGRPSRDPLWDPLMLSGLAFAGANGRGDGRDDGRLTAKEVSWLDLSNTELCVLSACETGLGALQTAEGVMGLSAGFLEAGAENVLLPLWKVPDQGTRHFMESFYQRWLSASRSPGAALRDAQLERRRAGDAPLAWGTWMLVGRPSQAPRDDLRGERGGLPLSLFALAMLALISGFLCYRWRRH